MKKLWQAGLSFATNILFPLTILLFPLAVLDFCLSGLYWYFEPAVGKVVCMADTTATLLIAVSSVVLGRLLWQQRTETSPYIYQSGYSLLVSRSYFGIEATDREAFYRLLRAVRRREAMAPLRPWLITNDAVWIVLLVGFAPIVIVVVIVLSVMRGFSQLIGRTFRAQRANGR